MIVACTANDYQNEWEKCRKAGMTKFLNKPPAQGELKKLLIEVFGVNYSPMLAEE